MIESASISSPSDAVQTAAFMQQGMNALGTNEAGEKAADKTAQDFMSMFMSQMLKPMFDTIDVDDSFGGGHGEEVMRSFLVQEYGKAMANNMAFDLRDTIKESILRKQAMAAYGGHQEKVGKERRR